MKAVTIINQGGGSAGDDAEEKVRAALAAAEIAGDVCSVSGDKCAARAAEAVDAGASLVIAAGGDGTMSAVAGALAGSKAAMGVLPLGTLNHFARDLGIPADLGEAARVIAAGRTQKVDVADLSGRTFINNSAIGLYPLMVIDREAQQRRLGRSKKLALAVAALRTLVRYRHQRLTLTLNDRKATLDTPLLFVGNNDYELVLPEAGKRSSLSDGQLCVLVLRSKSRLGFLAATFRAMLGRARADDMVRLDGVERLRVSSHRSTLAIAVDGEVIHHAPPADYSIRKGALTVVVPAPSGAAG